MAAAATQPGTLSSCWAGHGLSSGLLQRTGRIPPRPRQTWRQTGTVLAQRLLPEMCPPDSRLPSRPPWYAASQVLPAQLCDLLCSPGRALCLQSTSHHVLMCQRPVL